METLRGIAKQEGITLSELLRNLTEEITLKHGKKYKRHEGEEQ